MNGVGVFAIALVIICGGYLYFDYTKDRKKLIINLRQECKNAL